MIRAFYFLSAVWIGLLVLSLVALAQQVSVVPKGRVACTSARRPRSSAPARPSDCARGRCTSSRTSAAPS